MRVLLICPIPIEYTSCRTSLSLRDGPRVLGCRTALGSAANVDVMAVESGPAKARAASSTVAAIGHFRPDLVVDTGTCGALDGDLIVNSILFAVSCLEYDISGNGLPGRVIAEMKLPSALAFLPRKEGQKLVRVVTELGKNLGFYVRSGIQACGEFFIQSAPVRESLRTVSGADTCNWETAGVFVGSLRSRVPPLSIRVISDLGDEDSLRDFRRNARRCVQDLYRFIASALESGWFAGFHEQWKTVPRAQVERMPQSVLP